MGNLGIRLGENREKKTCLLWDPTGMSLRVFPSAGSGSKKWFGDPVPWDCPLVPRPLVWLPRKLHQWFALKTPVKSLRGRG